MRWLVRRLRDAYEPGDDETSIIPTGAELDAWARVEPRIERRLMTHSFIGIAAGTAIGAVLTAIANPAALWQSVPHVLIGLFLPLSVMWFVTMFMQSHSARNEFIQSLRLREAMRRDDADNETLSQPAP